jgi:hypothetical protein
MYKEIAVCVLLLTSSQVSAQQIPLHVPPEKFDYPFRGKLVVKRVDSNQLMQACSIATLQSLGCAFVNNDRCLILLVDDETIRAKGWTKELMLRHEQAHCNGWPQDHAGARSLESISHPLYRW